MRNVFDAFLTRQRGRFVLFLPAFMAAGILAYFAAPTEPSLAAALAAAATLVGLAAAAWRWPVARAAVLCAAFAATGFALAGVATRRAPPWVPLPAHAVDIAGTVAELDLLPDGRRIAIASPSIDGSPPQPRALRIRLRSTDTPDLTPGDEVQVRALVRPPSPPDYPGGWDTQREAYFTDLGGFGFAIGPVLLRHHAAAGWLAALRSRLAARITHALPGAPGAIAATLLTGSGTAIPQDDRAAFQASGLAHLLAVAGLHVGIVMGVAFAAVRFGLAAWEWAALHWPTRQIAALAAGLAYLALTGAHVPILRSFAMAALVTLGILTGRRAVSLRGLALAATLLMATGPESVVGVSFQMSFSAVLVLITGHERAQPALARIAEGAWWRRPLLYAGGLACTSLLAGTASLPFAAYHFGQATLFYVPANLVAVPLTALWVMPWGMAALLLMPMGLDSWALAPMALGIRALLAIAHGIAAWPYATLPVPQSPPWGLGLVAAGLVWACLWRGRLCLAGLAPLAAGLASPLLVTPPDILIGPEARLIAVRLPGTIMAETAPDATRFEQEAPARVWGSAAVPFTTQPGVSCEPTACRVALPGRRLLLVRAATAIDCAATLIVSPAWLHDPCPDLPVFDHAASVRTGAITLWLSPAGIVAVTDRTLRGDRPWVVAAPSRLPMAPTE